MAFLILGPELRLQRLLRLAQLDVVLLLQLDLAMPTGEQLVRRRALAGRQRRGLAGRRQRVDLVRILVIVRKPFTAMLTTAAVKALSSKPNCMT